MLSHKLWKLYQCSVCEKRFSYKINFTYHVWCHTGEKLYQCSQCDKAFQEMHYFNAYKETHRRKKHTNAPIIRIALYIRHNKTHESTYWREVYSCIKCDRIFFSHCNWCSSQFWDLEEEDSIENVYFSKQQSTKNTLIYVSIVKKMAIKFLIEKVIWQRMGARRNKKTVIKKNMFVLKGSFVKLDKMDPSVLLIFGFTIILILF